MNENMDKGTSWKQLTIPEIRHGLERELKELDASISKREYIDAELECADCANFLAMMVEALEERQV